MSAIDICNAALAKNHHMDRIPAGTDLTAPVGKAQTVCAEFYDQARRASFRLAPWTCITKRKVLQNDRWLSAIQYYIGQQVVEDGAVFSCTTAGTSGALAPTWAATGGIADGTAEWTHDYNIISEPPVLNLTQYAYAYPIPADYINHVEIQIADGTPADFEMERYIVYTNQANPVLRYIPDETDDSLWDPLLREVVIAQLASMIAYPLTGSHENEVAFAQAAMALAETAIKKTRREQRQGAAPGPQWMDSLYGERYQ